MISTQLAPSQGGLLFLAGDPEDEDLVKGWPLTGSAGFLLSRALRAAGLTAPGDDVLPATYHPDLRGETRRLLWERRQHTFHSLFSSPIPEEELKSCLRSGSPQLEEALDRLAQVVEKVKPWLIIPLGPAALYSVTGSFSIDALRGSVGYAPSNAPIMTRLSPGSVSSTPGSLKLLPTCDPKTVLKAYKLMIPLMADLVKARKEAQSPDVTPHEVEIWLEPNLADLGLFFDRHISASDLLSVDIETGGGQISCVGIATDPRTAIVLPFVDYRQPDRSYWRGAREELAAWEWLVRVLDTPTPKLMQNGAGYDVFWFLDKAGIPVRNYRHDLRLVHHVLFPELPKSLSYMGSLYTNLPAWKAGVQHDDKRDA